MEILTPYQLARNGRILIAHSTPGFDRVKYHDGPLVRLDMRTGVAGPYPRQQRRNRDREEARAPSFTDRLVFALSQIEWREHFAYATNGLYMKDMLASMGLMSTSPMSSVIGRRVKRYRAAYLSERQEPSADYSKRYQALFPVHAGEAVR